MIIQTSSLVEEKKERNVLQQGSNVWLIHLLIVFYFFTGEGIPVYALIHNQALCEVCFKPFLKKNKFYIFWNIMYLKYRCIMY